MSADTNHTESAMRITAIETSVVSLPFTMGGPYQLFAGQLWNRMEILLVKVETEDGLMGWGEAFGHAKADAAHDQRSQVGAVPRLVDSD